MAIVVAVVADVKVVMAIVVAVVAYVKVRAVVE